MPLSLRGIFLPCIPFLVLDVQGAAINPAGAWQATFTAAPGQFVNVRAFAPIGTPVAWAIATNGAGPVAAPPVGAVDPNDATIYQIPLSNPVNVLHAANTIRVTATAAGLTQFVDIVVKPSTAVLAVEPDHYAFTDAAGSYALDLRGYVDNPGDRLVSLRVTTTPDNASAWSHILWLAADAAALPYILRAIDDNHKGIPLDGERTITVTAAIQGTAVRSAPLTVEVRRPPGDASGLANGLSVELARFDFAGAGRFDVIQEDYLNFNQPYDAGWDRGFTGNPQGYTANTAMALNNVGLAVSAQPAGGPTNVTVRASAYFPTAAGALTVLQATAGPAAVAAAAPVNTAVAIGNIAYAAAVPDEVMLNNPLLIFWEVSTDGGANWNMLRVTANTVYITARAPAPSTWLSLNNGGGPVYTYDSLLWTSCRAALGQAGGLATRDAVRDAIAGAFAPANPNNQIRRLRRCGTGALPPPEPQGLGYWLPGAPSVAMGLQPQPDADSSFFFNRDRNMQCSVWAELLLAMWCMHGIGDGHLVYIAPSVPGKGLAAPAAVLANTVANSVFLVANWVYNQPASVQPLDYTHTIIPAVAAPGNIPVANPPRAASVNNGVAGQNNPNPPPQFICHYIVRDGNNDIYFDPSYGAGPLDRDTWVEASVAGLRNNDFTSPTFGMAGYVRNLPPNTPPNLNAVALRDESTGGWIP